MLSASTVALAAGTSCGHPQQGLSGTRPAVVSVLPGAVSVYPSSTSSCGFRNGRARAALWLGHISMGMPRRASSLRGSTPAFSLGQPATGAFLKAAIGANRPPPAHGRREKAKPGKKEHHLWMKRDSAGSGQKALNLARIISKLPNEKEAIYGALDKWSAFETEFPLIAIAKALQIFRKRNQWLHIIQVTKWMLNKGQGMTMGTYDLLLLAFDMDGRVDEAETIWNKILQTHTRSVSKRLFSRMISVYDHHHMPDKILEVFADMEELGVKPDEDTVRRVGRVFQNLGQEDNQKRLLQKYETKFRYLHFNGERVRVRNSRECGVRSNHLNQ